VFWGGGGGVLAASELITYLLQFKN
jgi:hypothetical protein